MSYSIIQNVGSALIKIRWYLREFLFRHFIDADAFYVMILLIHNLLGPLVCLYCYGMHHFIIRNCNSMFPIFPSMCFFVYLSLYILDHRYLWMLHPSFVYIYETKLVLICFYFSYYFKGLCHLWVFSSLSFFLAWDNIRICFLTWRVTPGTIPQCHAGLLHIQTRMEMLLMGDEERMEMRRWYPEDPPPYPLTEGRHLEKFHLKDLPTHTPSTDHNSI